MALTPAVFREAIGLLRDDERIFLDSSGNIILAVAIVDADGNHIIPSLTSVPTDLEMSANLTVGTSEVKIPIVATATRNIRVRAKDSNAGVIGIGKTGVKSDGTNDYILLESGDEHSFDFNIVDNDLYAIASEVDQILNWGVIL